MKPQAGLLLFLVAITGCFPLRQIELVQGPIRPQAILYDQSLLVGFDLNQEKIDTRLSYIESPANQLYALEIQPHQFDIEQKHGYVKALLFPIAEDGSRLQSWRNGTWSFHFVVESNGVTQVIDQKWKYYFFYYSPFIHGAPN